MEIPSSGTKNKTPGLNLWRNDLETTKSYLISISSDLLRALDGTLSVSPSVNSSFIRQYCAKDFTMEYYPDIEFPWPRTCTVDGLIDHIVNLKRENPAWRMHAYNFSVVLDRECESGVVWFTSGPSGDPPSEGGVEGEWWSTNRESVSKLKWRRRVDGDGEWECLGHLVIRGGGSWD